MLIEGKTYEYLLKGCHSFYIVKSVVSLPDMAGRRNDL